MSTNFLNFFKHIFPKKSQKTFTKCHQHVNHMAFYKHSSGSKATPPYSANHPSTSDPFTPSSTPFRPRPSLPISLLRDDRNNGEHHSFRRDSPPHKSDRRAPPAPPPFPLTTGRQQSPIAPFLPFSFWPIIVPPSLHSFISQ